MSLAELRMDKSSDEAMLGAQTKRTVVVRHVDKVLETLAMFRSKKPRQTLTCAVVPGVESLVKDPSEPKASWEGEMSARGALVADSWVRVVFGTLIAVGKPPDDQPRGRLAAG